MPYFWILFTIVMAICLGFLGRAAMTAARAAHDAAKLGLEAKNAAEQTIAIARDVHLILQESTKALNECSLALRHIAHAARDPGAKPGAGGGGRA